MSEKKEKERRKTSNKETRTIKKIKLEEEKLEGLRQRQKQIKKENRIQFHIRNLKIAGKMIHSILPYVLSTTIISGIVNLVGGGLPIIKDNITIYKTQNLEYKTDEEILETTAYQSSFDFSESNNLKIYTPWEKEGNNYIRYIREYNLTNSDALKIYTAILEENYKKIEDSILDYTEEKQIRNIVNLENNSYHIEANLSFLDAEEQLQMEESDLKNMIITIVDGLIGMLIGLAAIKMENFNYSYEIKKINNDYRLIIKDIKPVEEEIKNTQEKIRVLKKKKEENHDDE